MRLGARAMEVREDPDGVTAVTDVGEVFTADVLVGADGIDSTVRAMSWPTSARFDAT